MNLNIKNHETYELVKELATLKGTSLSYAVQLAVRNEIEREKAAKEGAGDHPRPKRSELLQAFAREFSRQIKNPIHSWDIDRLLYDEDGLPK